MRSRGYMELSVNKVGLQGFYLYLFHGYASRGMNAIPANILFVPPVARILRLITALPMFMHKAMFPVAVLKVFFVTLTLLCLAATALTDDLKSDNRRALWSAAPCAFRAGRLLPSKCLAAVIAILLPKAR